MTTSSEPELVELAAVIAEFESISRRDYGQFCGVARAQEVIGERWSLLIIRDLLVGARGRAELRAGLPRIPNDTLTARLREFERDGIVRARRGAQGTIVYELTELGRELEESTDALGRWGARLLTVPRPGEIVTVNALITAMRATFDPAAARGVRAGYEIGNGDLVFHLRVADGVLDAAQGPLPDADLVLLPGNSLKALLSGELSPADAIATGAVRVHGDPALLALFVRLFHLDV